MNVWNPNSPLGGLPFIKKATSLRSSSRDQTGANRDFKIVSLVQRTCSWSAKALA